MKALCSIFSVCKLISAINNYICSAQIVEYRSAEGNKRVMQILLIYFTVLAGSSIIMSTGSQSNLWLSVIFWLKSRETSNVLFSLGCKKIFKNWIFFPPIHIQSTFSGVNCPPPQYYGLGEVFFSKCSSLKNWIESTPPLFKTKV